jgi:hypothetical protein
MMQALINLPPGAPIPAPEGGSALIGAAGMIPNPTVAIALTGFPSFLGSEPSAILYLHLLKYHRKLASPEICYIDSKSTPWVNGLLLLSNCNNSKKTNRNIW